LRTAVCLGVNEVMLHFAEDHAVRAVDVLCSPFDAPRDVEAFARMDGFNDALETLLSQAAGPRAVSRHPNSLVRFLLRVAWRFFT